MGNAPVSATGGTAQGSGTSRERTAYPEQVNRHLGRLRRPNTRFDGAAVVAFTIAPGGGLAAIAIARSSGNAEFDQLALSHIQRAVPFPAPPDGAQRSFNVTVQGR
jgi:protein TonB